MFCHWRYVLDNIFGAGARGATRLGATHIPERVDEDGQAATRPRPTTRPTATFELDGGDHRADQLVVGGARVPRRAARAPGGRHARAARSPACATARPSTASNTPHAGLEPGHARTRSTSATTGRTCRTTASSTTASSSSGSCSCATSRSDDAVPVGLLEGAKGVQLAELGLQSWRERRWLDVPELGALRGDELDALPRLTGRSRTYTLGAARASPRPTAPLRSASPSPRRTSSPTRWRDDRRRHRRARLGRDARLPPPPLVATGSASPRRWTPRSAAMGLDWPAAQELIRRSARRGARRAAARSRAAPGPISSRRRRRTLADGARAPTRSRSRSSRATGAPVILMASRALAPAAAHGRRLPRDLRRACCGRSRQPVILHWLGDMFDPRSPATGARATSTRRWTSCLGVIDAHADEGRRHQDLAARRGARDRRCARRLPAGRAHVHRRRLQLPGADPRRRQRLSDALLGIFDAIAPAAAAALQALDAGDVARFDATARADGAALAAHLRGADARTTRRASSSSPT